MEFAGLEPVKWEEIELKMQLNGSEIEVKSGDTILSAAKRNGVNIPTLCNFPGHESGVCRLCLVESKESGRPVPACSTRVREGMKVVTDSDSLTEYRRTLISLYMRNHPPHPEYKGEKCDLHRYANEYGVKTDPLIELVEYKDVSHPGISFDPSLCVECRKCITACNEEQGNYVISVVGKGASSSIGFDNDVTLGSSSCASCGMCVDVCPTGALIEKNWEPADRTVTSTCPYCAVGCQIEYGIKGNNIVWARGVAEGVNEGKLCVKGKFGFQFESSPDRLTVPLVRRDGITKGPLNGRDVKEVFREATWDEALATVADRMKSTIHSSGGSSIGGIASDRSTNEDVYAFQKFMRAVVKSDNVDQSATLCHSPSAVMLSWGLGAGASTNPIYDVFNSKTIMVVGSNTDRSHPVLSANIKKARRKGAFLIVVDPRRLELAKQADMFLQIKPGTDVYLFMSMAKYIVEHDLEDKEYLENFAEGYNEFKDSLKNYSMEKASAITGLPESTIEAAAERYAASKPSSIFWTLGITEHENGSDNVSSLVNLAILTGNIGIKGGGLNPIRGQNNVQGGADVGGTSGSLPGYQNLSDPKIRGRFEDAWKTKIPDKAGMKSTEMVEDAIRKNLKLLYISGENSVRSHPNAKSVDQALRNLDFLIVQDLFLTETAEYADVVLPAASGFEKTGTYTNTERRVQLVRKILDPPGKARPDWKIYSDLSGMMGYDLGFESPSDIMDEMNLLMPTWSGITHSRLELSGLQWPVPGLESNGTEILHVNGAMRGKARMKGLSWNKSADMNYPYTLITGRERSQYHTSTMSGRAKVLNEVSLGPVIQMNKEDMVREDVLNGDKIEIESSTGSVSAVAIASDELPEGVMFTTFHYASLRANDITSPVLDPITKTPAYKDTRVRIVRAT